MGQLGPQRPAGTGRRKDEALLPCHADLCRDCLCQLLSPNLNLLSFPGLQSSASSPLLPLATLPPSLTPILDGSEPWCRSLSWSHSVERAASTLLRELCTVRTEAAIKLLSLPDLLPATPRTHTHPSGPRPRNFAAGGHSLRVADHGDPRGPATPGSETGLEQSHGDDQPVGEGEGLEGDSLL